MFKHKVEIFFCLLCTRTQIEFQVIINFFVRSFNLSDAMWIKCFKQKCKTFIKSSRRRGANSSTRLKSCCRLRGRAAESRVNCFCIKSSACCRKQKKSWYIYKFLFQYFVLIVLRKKINLDKCRFLFPKLSFILLHLLRIQI